MSIKLICFDMDGTLIKESKWSDFNQCLGVPPAQDQAWYDAFTSGEITYDTWLEKLRTAYDLPRAGVTHAVVSDCLTRFTLQPGARAAVRAAAAMGISSAVITGSFDISATALADELNLGYAISNTSCVFDATGKLVDICSGGEEGEAKVQYLRALCVQIGCELTDTLVVGDGVNDIPLFTQTDNGVAFSSCDKKVRVAARYTIEDLSALPKLLNDIA
jgi:phosphoserine phosphatase